MADRSVGECGFKKFCLTRAELGFMLLFLSACSPEITEKVHTVYVEHEVHHRDTLIQKDSVYIKEYIKGDTVYRDKFRDRYVYRDRWRDSVQVKEVHDTTTVEKKVEKELTAGQKMKINSFWWLLVGLALALVWIFRKSILKLFKIIV